MNGATLAALLYLVPGTPHDLDGPDHESGCYLGDYAGGKARLVYDGPPVVPFYVGAPGALVRDGVAPVTPDARPVEGVVVHAAEVYEVTRECAVPDHRAADPWASGLVLNEGELFVFYSEDCDNDNGLCRTTSNGREFETFPGTCEAERKKATVPAGQLGWWVPMARNGVNGWVRGDAGFHVEAKCFGPDDGAAKSMLQWHRL